MIRNLNAVTFQSFGTVLSERPQAAKNADKEPGMLVEVTSAPSVVYRASSETRLNIGKGKAVLSVSLDGEHYQHFYLDKSACIYKDVYFCLIPFMGEAAVQLYFHTRPLQTGLREESSVRMDSGLRVDGIYTFFYQEKEQGFLFSGESHPIYELTYVDQGSLHSVLEGQDTLLSQGDVVIYGPDQWHMHYADIGVAPRYVTITFDLKGGDLGALLNRKLTAPQHTVQLLQRMLREQELMDAFSNDMIISQLNVLLLHLLREEASPKAGKLQASNSIHSENEIVRQAQQYISSHIREKLSVPLVAQQVDVSASYLTALFHKNLQISPGEYIRRIKLQESKQMIRENNLNFTEIAAALRYSTVHHFSRQFKEKFGITPSEYAKSVR